MNRKICGTNEYVVEDKGNIESTKTYSCVVLTLYHEDPITECRVGGMMHLDMDTNGLNSDDVANILNEFFREVKDRGVDEEYLRNNTSIIYNASYHKTVINPKAEDLEKNRIFQKVAEYFGSSPDDLLSRSISTYDGRGFIVDLDIETGRVRIYTERD